MAAQSKISRVFETSAKTGYNVEDLFATVAKELYLEVLEREKKENETVPEPTADPVPNPNDRIRIGGGGSNAPTGGNNPTGKPKKKGCC